MSYGVINGCSRLGRHQGKYVQLILGKRGRLLQIVHIKYAE